jgi:DNA processing protein
MNSLLKNALSLREEMTAYETLWGMQNATQKSIAQLFHDNPGLPTSVLSHLRSQNLFLESLYEDVRTFIKKLSGFSVSVHGTFQYPEILRRANYPLELFYYRGHIELAEGRCVSVVGARKVSAEGVKRAERLARELVEAGFTIVSGLAAGVDTAAMQSAMQSGGKTIGVIGTPINQVYPIENAELQEKVAKEHLLVSQVPFFRYEHQPFNTKRFYFPQRNETMAALSEATIIVEASDTSGSLTQARAAIKQGKKLFILNSCFENKNISWPRTYEEKGAVRVRSTNDIVSNLKRES